MAAMSLLRSFVDGKAADEFLAFVGDDASLEALSRYAEANGWPGDAVCQGGPDAAMDLLMEGAAPRLLVVDIDLAGDPAAEVARLVAQCASTGRVVVIGSANDVGLYRAMMAAGAAEYLVKPIGREALTAAVRLAGSAPREREVQTRRCILSVVVGVRGGVGASTIAVNLSWLLAHEQKLRTALLDLDLYFGTGALALDLEPGRGLREALECPDRLDGLLLASSMVNESERLCVLGAEEPIEASIQMDASAPAALLRQLRAGFDCIVVDLPRHLLPAHRQLVAEAENVVLVSDFSLAGIRDTARVQGLVDALGGTGNCITVASRVGGERRAQMDKATFERGIKGGVAFVVPEDVKSVAASANLGKSIGSVAGNTPINKVLRDLAQQLSGVRPPAPKGLLRRLARTVKR